MVPFHNRLPDAGAVSARPEMLAILGWDFVEKRDAFVGLVVTDGALCKPTIATHCDRLLER
jgi:hypothetical protein